MAADLNTFEGGTNGANVIAASSGGTSGKAFAVVVSNNVSGGGAGSSNIIYTSAWKTRGALGCRMTLTASSSYLRIDATTTGTRMVARRPLYFDTTLPSANFTALSLYSGTSTLMANIQINSSGQVRAYRNSTLVSGANGTYTMTTGVQYWLEFAATPESGGGTNAVIEWKLTNAAGNTTHDSGSATGLPMGTGTIDVVRFGGGTTATGLTYDWFDDLAVEAKATTNTWIGSANSAPTQVLTANQNVAASASVSVTTVPTDDGSISSYLWSYVSASSTGSPSLTNSTTATASFTASTAGNLYTLQSLITDDGALTATNTTEVRVPITGATTGVPLALNGTSVVGTMTNTGGAGTDGAALADASDSTYIESGTVTGTEQSERYRWQPSGSRAAADVVLRLATDTGTANVNVRLYEGATLRQSWGPQAITSSITNYTFSLSGGTISAISDWGNLFLEWGATT